MNLRFSSLTPALRVFGYFCVAFLIWGVWSIPPLLSFNHAGFQSAGTIIICWAIFFIGRDRLRFEKSISNHNHDVIVAAINRLEAHRAFDEKRLDFTFNMHQIQISTISHAIGLKNTFGPQTLEYLDRSRKALEENIANNPEEYKLEEDEVLAKSYSEMLHARLEHGKWRNVTFSAEIAFLISGTLQTGYGAQFSSMVAEAGITAKLNFLLSNLLS